MFRVLLVSTLIFQVSVCMKMSDICNVFTLPVLHAPDADYLKPQDYIVDLCGKNTVVQNDPHVGGVTKFVCARGDTLTFLGHSESPPALTFLASEALSPIHIQRRITLFTLRCGVPIMIEDVREILVGVYVVEIQTPIGCLKPNKETFTKRIA